MPTFAVEYRYDDRTDVRDEVRPEHRRFLAALLEEGALIGSGPFAPAPGEPAGALLLVRADDAAAVEALLDADPFWRHNLVAGRSVRAWEPVLRSWEE